jgi:hypothetical protein
VTASAPTSLPHRAAAVILAAVLVLLAFRLTASETLRDTLAQKIANLAQAAAPRTADNPGPVPFVGPAFTAAYAAIAFLLAGAAAWLALRAEAFGRRQLGQLGLIAVILGLALGSTFHAENRFNALIGTADVAAALAAAWTVALVCHDALLGQRGRQAVMAAIITLCALGGARALLQKFVDFPDSLQYFNEHREEALRNSGINPDDPVQVALFVSRLKSAEVSGFGAMSNVFATQMIAGISLLTALGAAAIRSRRTVTAPVARTPHRPPARHSGGDIPLHVISQVGLLLLLILSLAVLAMTNSKGAIAAAALALAAIGLGIAFRRRVEAQRRHLLACAVAAALLLPTVTVGWGLTHHGLPTRSLLFRWQYWTAAAPMVRNSPLWGVGLNNFGDFYKRYKSPSSPEDVQDPHSFFVRLAAEAGIPATIAVATLILCMVQGAWRRRVHPAAADTPAASQGIYGPLILGGCGAVAWLPLHFLAEAMNEYTLILNFLFFLLSWTVFAAVMTLFDALDDSATRIVSLAGVVGALAMLLYDQVNMALVTGPVAMLFWMMLAVGESSASTSGAIAGAPVPVVRRWPRWLRFSIPSALLAVSVATAAVLLFPLASGTFAWDPAPCEYAYITQFQEGQVEPALTSLNAALERAPNNIELRMQRIALLRDRLHRPVAAEIRKIFELDRANAAPRLLLALPDSDLPAPERIAALQDALAFDQQLPPGEVKHLSPEQLRNVKATIARLRSGST